MMTSGSGRVPETEYTVPAVSPRRLGCGSRRWISVPLYLRITRLKTEEMPLTQALMSPSLIAQSLPDHRTVRACLSDTSSTVKVATQPDSTGCAILLIQWNF